MEDDTQQEMIAFNKSGSLVWEPTFKNLIFFCLHSLMCPSTFCQAQPNTQAFSFSATPKIYFYISTLFLPFCCRIWTL